jgi:hypothetical protein
MGAIHPVGHLIDVMATCVDVCGAAYPAQVGETGASLGDIRQILPELTYVPDAPRRNGSAPGLGLASSSASRLLPMRRCPTQVELLLERHSTASVHPPALLDRLDRQEPGPITPPGSPGAGPFSVGPAWRRRRPTTWPSGGPRARPRPGPEPVSRKPPASVFPGETLAVFFGAGRDPHRALHARYGRKTVETAGSRDGPALTRASQLLYDTALPRRGRFGTVVPLNLTGPAP